LKRTLFSIMTLMLVVGLVGGGALAYFSDVETSTGNNFTAGTLNLKVDVDPTPAGDNFVDNPTFPSVMNLSNLYPGWTEDLTIQIKNVGTIDGTPNIKLTNIVNNENGVNNPESKMSPPDTDATGELGASIYVTVQYNDRLSTTGVLWEGWLNDFKSEV
jgi:spore coat-associated protein N